MGLLDNINGGGGLLPFANRWNDATSSLAGLPPWAGNTLAAIQAGGSPYTPRFFSGGAPQNMPAQSPTNAQGGGILPNAQEPPPDEAMAQAAPGAAPQGGFWGNLFNGISNGIAAHPQTLMAMAGGFGQPGWGFGNAMRAAGPAMQHDQQLQLLQQSQSAAYQAIRSAGGTHAQAMAAAASPEVFKTLAPELFGSPKIVQTGENPLGKQFMMQQGNRLYPIGGAEGQPGSIAGGGAGGGGGMGAGLLAPGVKQYDAGLTGDAYLNQFGPEVQAAVKAYMKGDVMPTGNPRLQGLQPFAKQVAQKYGQDMGIPVSDAIYNEKRRFFTELGSTTTGVGGQSKAFSQGIEHAVALADKLKKLDNSNGFGIPVVAEGINAVRQHFSNTLSAVSDEAATIGQTLAGEVGKLFAGSAGGGVHERELTRQRFNTVKSKPQLAAALEATLETMEGGLTALEQRRDAVLGPNSGVDLIPQQTRDNMNKLRGIISELKTGNAAPTSGGVVRWQRGPNGIPQPVTQ